MPSWHGPDLPFLWMLCNVGKHHLRATWTPNTSGYTIGWSYRPRSIQFASGWECKDFKRDAAEVAVARSTAGKVSDYNCSVMLIRSISYTSVVQLFLCTLADACSPFGRKVRTLHLCPWLLPSKWPLLPPARGSPSETCTNPKGEATDSCQQKSLKLFCPSL